MKRETIKRIILGSALVSGMILALPIEAQNNSGRAMFGNSSSSKSAQTATRQHAAIGNGATVTRSTTTNSRPASTGIGNRRPNGNNNNNNNSGIGNGARPNGNNNHNNNSGIGNGARPNGNNNHNNNSGIGNGARPNGNNHHNNSGNYRPGNGNNYRPNGNYGGNYHNWGGNSRPGAPASASRPNGRPAWNTHVAPSMRPYRPYGRPIPRPIVPRGYRPRYGAPIISGILGLTFGSLYANSLDYLYDRNYIIDGYTDNTVYLCDVSELSYIWPDVILNYSYNRLANAQFIYSTAFYDTSRFDRVYDRLCNIYGSPVSSRDLGYDATEVVWYGGNRQGLVTLEFYSDNGRYFTVLAYGNE